MCIRDSHVGDTLALDRMGDDGGRSTVAPGRLLEDPQDVGHVVAVHFEDAPPEGGPLGDELARDLRRDAPVRTVAGPAVLLKLVVVDDDDEVVEGVARRGHRRLPCLTLCLLYTSPSPRD